MNKKHKTFEYFILKLIELYINDKGISLFEFNKNNNFSVLKSIKLLFFIVTASANDKRLTSLFNNFYALSHGPVELTIYKNIFNTQKMFFDKDCVRIQFPILNIKEIIKHEYKNIDETYNKIFQKSIFHINNILSSDTGIISLLNKSPWELVNISKKYPCWYENWELACKKGTRLMKIKETEIIIDFITEKLYYK